MNTLAIKLFLLMGFFVLPLLGIAQNSNEFKDFKKQNKTEQIEKVAAAAAAAADPADECFFSLNPNFTAASITNSLACPGGAYQTLQIFDLQALGLTGGTLDSVCFGVFESFGNAPVIVNVYTLNGPISYPNMSLVATGNTILPNGGARLETVGLDVPYNAANDDTLVIELVTQSEATNGFIPGYNTSTLVSGTTYLASNFCNLPQPTPASNALPGFTEEALISIVLCEQNVPIPTMSQWALLLFGLIVTTLGVVTIYNYRKQLA